MILRYDDSKAMTLLILLISSVVYSETVSSPKKTFCNGRSEPWRFSETIWINLENSVYSGATLADEILVIPCSIKDLSLKKSNSNGENWEIGFLGDCSNKETSLTELGNTW
ncbi:hypothetical protein WICPIJ_000388 [Wickerhamomyces pijperi]|uniref:Uncharacterized protein n=1 Tax=Wickerhamomyces pijperi TaxID=599730 RepID=A0A9P8TSN4_WICPI|nr:hypothetical protein WICPIJ_000388 [Wickerhamomyces pijperi]